MSLNQTQRRTLGSVVRGAADSVLELNLRDFLSKTTKPVGLKLPEVIKTLKAHPELLLDPRGDFAEGQQANVNIPVEIRSAWHQLCLCFKTNAPNIPSDVLKKLENSPNHNPFLIAEMRKFEDELSEIKSADAKLELIRLREAFLEMTPQHEYCYGQGYPTYYFRIGNVPFNLDMYGEKPQKGEISDYIMELLEDRLTIYDETQVKLKQEQKTGQDAKAELEKIKKLQEQTQAQLTQALTTKNTLQKTLEHKPQAKLKQNHIQLICFFLTLLFLFTPYGSISLIGFLYLINEKITDKKKYKLIFQNECSYPTYRYSHNASKEKKENTIAKNQITNMLNRLFGIELIALKFTDSWYVIDFLPEHPFETIKKISDTLSAAGLNVELEPPFIIWDIKFSAKINLRGTFVEIMKTLEDQVLETQINANRVINDNMFRSNRT